jgi:hypothetical protein
MQNQNINSQNKRTVSASNTKLDEDYINSDTSPKSFNPNYPSDQAVLNNQSNFGFLPSLNKASS